MIYAKDYYSRSSLQVYKGKIYHFSVSLHDKWVDLVVPCNAMGYRNFLLRNSKKRVQGACCFELCGTIEGTEEDHFQIGVDLRWECPKDGRLFFFANDHKRKLFYRNNFGKIKLSVAQEKP